MRNQVKDNPLYGAELTGPGSELAISGSKGKSSYDKCLRVLQSLGIKELALRQAFVERATCDLGENVDRVQQPGIEKGVFQLDLFPRLLHGDDWHFIEQAVLQRARAFRSYIVDVYGRQDILHAGILPPELVFEDPAYYPELTSLAGAEPNPLIVGAVDLAKTTDGHWRVLENRFSTPTGMAYLIQIRRIMAQALPEALSLLPVHAVASFAARFSEALADSHPDVDKEKSIMVLLSAGESGRHFFEESFLARQMGIPLVRAHDLIVRDGRVQLKTVSGLVPVDIIYRRMENPLLDPVAFTTTGEAGIPGLVHCVRSGTVSISNGLSCSVADNRALLPHTGDIIRFYLGEAPLIPAVRTLHGFDTDHIDYIRDHLDSLNLKTISHPDNLSRTFPEARRLFDAGKLETIFNKDPRLIVAQDVPPLATVPVFDGKTFHMEEVSLRVFFAMGKQPFVIPGGLTRRFSRQHESLRSGERDHLLKDTWVLGMSGLRMQKRKGRLESSLTRTEPPLASGSAESFYWMGRYFERARSTTRMRKVLAALHWDELSPRERDLHLPLLEAISHVTDQPLGTKGRRQLRSTSNFGQSLLFGTENNSSVQSCFRALLRNAATVRSLITPEFYDAIYATDRLMQELATRAEHTDTNPSHLEAILQKGDLIYGVGERTLMHDSGWHFFQIGIGIERAQINNLFLKCLIPHIVRRQWEHLRDDTDLTAILRIVGALDAYHRSFRSRAYLDRMVHLLWKHPDCTASIRFCLRLISTSLDHILISINNQSVQSVAQSIEKYSERLDRLRIEDLFPARHRELDHGLTRNNFDYQKTEAAACTMVGEIEAFLLDLHQQLEDRFFAHHPNPPKA